MIAIYNFLSFFVKLLYQNKIVGKDVKGTNKTLYYEIGQHLTFLFRRKINYESSIQHHLKKYIHKNSIVYDIGCNVGQYMLIFSTWASEGKVISFEPDPKNYVFALFNQKINSISNVCLYNQGVGKIKGIATFYSDSKTGGRRSSFKKKFVGPTFRGIKNEVQIRTFESIVMQHGIPDFVKIDVEGFEEEVIAGMGDPADNTTFFIEVRSESKVNIFQFFYKKGFSCYLFAGNNLVEILNENQIPEFANLLFTKK